MTSTVWPNRFQGIINMLSGGTVVRFREPAPRRRERKWKTRVAPKGATPVFFPFPVFWEPQLDPLLNFQGSDSLPSEGYQNLSYAWDHPLLRISKIYNMVRKFWSLNIQPKSRLQVNGIVQTYSRTYCPNNCRHIHMWYVYSHYHQISKPYSHIQGIQSKSKSETVEA